MATVDNILNNLGLEKPANINNTNYYNNTNNTNNILTTSKIASFQEPSNQSRSLTSSPLGSLREEESDLSLRKKKTRKIPALWKGVKLDLFCNGKNRDGSASYKLNICVYDKLSGKQIQLMAALNSKFDSSVQRGVDKQDWRESSHWIKVKQTRKELNMIYEDVRGSKVGLKHNGGGTSNVVFVYQDRTGVWCVDFIREGEIYQFDLCDDINEKQTRANIIASGYHGSRMKKLLTNKELGI